MSQLKVQAGTDSNSNKSILSPGLVDLCYFRLLMSVCVMNSQSIYRALEDVLVHGKTRKEACTTHKVSQSYLSIKYRHVQKVNMKIARLCQMLNNADA